MPGDTKEEFDAMTDTGKFRAVTEANQRAEEAESKLSRIRRHALGLLDFVIESVSPDEIMQRVIHREEKVVK